MNTNISDYLDGIPLELSNEFYPLPAVNIDYIAALPPPPSLLSYDFSAERKAIKEFSDNEAKMTNKSLQAVKSKPVKPVKKQSIMPYLPSTSILQPQPAPSQPKVHSQPVKPRLSLEDFEPIHNSPFDALEIKSINDKEMLKQLLSTNCNPTPTPECSLLLNSSNQNGWPSLSRGRTVDLSSSVSSTESSSKRESNEEFNLIASKSFPDLTVNPLLQRSPLPTNGVPHGFHESKCRAQSLNEPQNLLDSAVNLGFDRNTAKRCINVFHNDSHKVMNALTLMKSLSQFYDANLVEEAVIHCDSDETKAKQFIFCASQLRSLGFPDSTIVDAVSRSEGSRDRALEYLLGKS